MNQVKNQVFVFDYYRYSKQAVYYYATIITILTNKLKQPHSISEVIVYIYKKIVYLHNKTQSIHVFKNYV